MIVVDLPAGPFDAVEETVQRLSDVIVQSAHDTATLLVLRVQQSPQDRFGLSPPPLCVPGPDDDEDPEEDAEQPDTTPDRKPDMPVDLSHRLVEAVGQLFDLEGCHRIRRWAEWNVELDQATEVALAASDAGYGFIATLSDLVSRNKAGKAILRVPAGGKAVVPAPVPKDRECLIAAVSSIGRLLLFEMEELPELAKGKGNKLINIPGKKYQAGEETMVAAAVVPEEGSLQVYTGTRMMTIKWDDVDDYYGERALRGSLLPKGWRKVERLIGID